MKVTSTGIINGIIADRFGKRGTQFNENGVPTDSLPIDIENAPRETMSFALIVEDKAAYPVVGFAWIHWLAANITRAKIAENESQMATDFVQGANSWTSFQGDSQSKELSSFYGGMTPPDRPHMYEIHVFALDTKLDLQNGFMLNKLFYQMEGHILAKDTLKGVYEN